MKSVRYDDPKLAELYDEERDKLSPLPDADADFIALDKALKRRFEELEVEDGQA